MQTRRRFLFTGGGALLAAAGAFQWRALNAMPLAASAPAPAEKFEVMHTEEQWRKQLSDNQFQVLRQGATERPYTSPLNDEHRSGRFACAGCQLEVFSSSTKFDSHTGWPSFWAPLDHAVASSSDSTFGMVRTEVHCRRCGGHLGHVFDDGPRPTGLRYCMNGFAMTFAAGRA
jgi:peptide-methionine (R)-S-oxide reductase